MIKTELFNLNRGLANEPTSYRGNAIFRLLTFFKFQRVFVENLSARPVTRLPYPVPAPTKSLRFACRTRSAVSDLVVSRYLLL
jgi:hypothetical protein